MTGSCWPPLQARKTCASGMWLPAESTRECRLKEYARWLFPLRSWHWRPAVEMATLWCGHWNPSRTLLPRLHTPRVETESCWPSESTVGTVAHGESQKVSLARIGATPLRGSWLHETCVGGAREGGWPEAGRPPSVPKSRRAWQMPRDDCFPDSAAWPSTDTARNQTSLGSFRAVHHPYNTLARLTGRSTVRRGTSRWSAICQPAASPSSVAAMSVLHGGPTPGTAHRWPVPQISSRAAGGMTSAGIRPHSR